MTPEITIVVPLFNARRNVEKCLESLLRQNYENYEIILVNDGSSDNTASIIEQIVQMNPQAHLLDIPKNRGKGYAVKSGVLDAGGKYIVYTDADLAVPVHFISTCLKRLESGIPMVIGSRHLPGSSFKVREVPLRQFLGEVFRRFALLSLGLRVSDITCGLKGLEREAAFKIFSRSKIDRWGYDAEIIFLAQKLGYTIGEIPVDWYHSFDSKVKICAASLKTFTEIFQIYYYYYANRYYLSD